MSLVAVVVMLSGGAAMAADCSINITVQSKQGILSGLQEVKGWSGNASSLVSQNNHVSVSIYNASDDSVPVVTHEFTYGDQPKSTTVNCGNKYELRANFYDEEEAVGSAQYTFEAKLAATNDNPTQNIIFPSTNWSYVGK